MGYETSPPAHLNRWLDLFPPGSPEIPLAELIFQATEVCAKLKEQAVASAIDNPPSFSDTKDYLRRARDLDSQLEDWSRNLPPRWAISSHEIARTDRPAWVATLLNMPGAPTIMHRYATPSTALFLNLYRVARVHLKLAIVDSLARISPFQGTDALVSDALVSPFQDTGALVSDALMMVGEICASVPTLLRITPSGDGDPQSADEVYGRHGFILLFPLLRSLKCCFRNDARELDLLERGNWVKGMLVFLWQDFGISKAEAYLEAYF